MHQSWSSDDADDGRFFVEVAPERDAVRICPVGEIDLGTVGEVRAELERLRQAGCQRLILDLRSTTFVDSTGLRLALDIHAASAADGFDFALHPGPPAVQHTFEIAGLSQSLPFIEPARDGRAGT